MKSLVNSLWCAVAMAAVLSVNGARANVEPGKPVPDFTFTDLEGKSCKLSDYRGKVVVLEWLNPGCPFVVRHYRSGNMPGTQATAAADGAVWLQVNSTAMGDLDPAKTLEWQKKQNVTAMAYIRDHSGKLGRLFGAKTTPHVFVIGKDGVLAYEGAIDDQPNANVSNTLDAHNYVKAALAALKAGRPIEKPSIPSYGCGVKYGSE